MNDTTHKIRQLFSSDISRTIEEVIKVDQVAEAILRDEIGEYIATGSIKKYFRDVLGAYRDALGHPTEGIGIWISGFFGSGKSSFAKMLGLAIENRQIAGEPAARRFAGRVGDREVDALLAVINEKIPTHTVIFDVSTERGIRSGNQMLTEIMYGLFLQSLGYAKDLDLSELEISLEAEGRLDAFVAAYREIVKKDWDAEKGKVAFALNEASRVLHHLEPSTYAMPDSWVRAIKGRTDISPGKLAERCDELMRRRRPGQNLLFVVDEVGQFVARDVQKMLDLMGIVQSLGRIGRGKHWLAVTSQEKLTELVGGLDDRRIELARLMDRFPRQVHLESSDISEVTSRRILDKNSDAESLLGRLFDDHRGRLTDTTRLTADIRLPELTRQGFIDLYPLLPYQIDLIVHIVSGLRTQGGASRHVGGANRTIIKLAQQLLINPAVQLADQPVGTLARIDQVYDLIEGNIGSEVRAKIAQIPQRVDHPLAQKVAKAVCLLQYVQSVHRTAENVAAALFPGVDADSQLPAVKEALQELVARHQVRLGEDGYRIPTPAEDDWERNRMTLSPRPGDIHRLQAETLATFWQPQQPSHTFLETKVFKAGLALQGREIVDGDIPFQMYLAEGPKEHAALAAELRVRSQQERRSVFWAVALNDAIDRETGELFRSKEMVARKEREAKTPEETRLISEEKIRQRRHQEELRRQLRAACLSGLVYFRGNDRSSGEQIAEVSRAAVEILGQVLPDVFDRYHEAAARVQRKDLDALLASENLQGLTPVFTSLQLLRDEKGKPVFRTESGPLAEVLRRIKERADYGEAVSGRYLEGELAKEPFGWDFEVVRLLILSLLRAGKIEMTSRGQTVDSARSLEAKDTFTNNNLFRQASFRPRQDVAFEELIRAAEAFRDTFGREVKELSAAPIAGELRREVDRHADTVALALAILTRERLPGGNLLESTLGEMKAIVRGSDESAIAGFNSAHRSIKEAIQRAAELEQALTEPRLCDLARAREALSVFWPSLRDEPDLPDDLRADADRLADLLGRETFFRELPAIEQMAGRLAAEYDRRYEQALAERIEAYNKALEALAGTSGWVELSDERRQLIAEPLQRGTLRPNARLPIPQLRADRDACGLRLKSAVSEVHKILAGERYVEVNLASYFEGGIENEEQLEKALDGIREECSRWIGAGKKVIVQ